jgi:hypothetical protein
MLEVAIQILFLDPVSLLHRAIPMVLDRIICATDKNLCHQRPLIFNPSLKHEQNPFLHPIPVSLLDYGIKMVVPSFSQLLRRLVCNLF